MSDDLVSNQELAGMLGISIQRLRVLVKRGDIAVAENRIVDGRWRLFYRRADVEALIRHRQEHPPRPGRQKRVPPPTAKS